MFFRNDDFSHLKGQYNTSLRRESDLARPIFRGSAERFPAGELVGKFRYVRLCTITSAARHIIKSCQGCLPFKEKCIFDY
jgi:hypothetical protein